MRENESISSLEDSTGKLLPAQRSLDGLPARLDAHGPPRPSARTLPFILLSACLPAALLPANRALADAATVNRGKVTVEAGAQVYQHVCQGCHMQGGRGATGAGAFPALANNPKLSVSGYPVVMILNGHGGMPWFNGILTPVQIAAVVNYVRTSFGNQYQDAVTPEFVAAAAGPPPTMER